MPRLTFVTLCAVCMFSPCQCVFSWVSMASSCYPNACMSGWLVILNWPNVNVSGFGLVCLCVGLVTCPGCSLFLAQWLLRKEVPSNSKLDKESIENGWMDKRIKFTVPPFRHEIKNSFESRTDSARHHKSKNRDFHPYKRLSSYYEAFFTWWYIHSRIFFHCLQKL